VRGQDYFRALALAPTASELPVELKKINWALIFIRPTGILDLPEFRIHEDQAPRAKKRVHSLIVRSYISIQIS
jgi:hypothetical protein